MTRRERILAFIRSFITDNGYPPSHEEIRAGVGISTKSLVSYHLDCLQRAG